MADAEHEDIKRTRVRIMHLGIGMGVLGVAYIAVFAAVIVVGTSMEETTKKVDKLEAVVGSVADIRSTNEKIKQNIKAEKTGLETVREIYMLREIMDEENNKEIQNLLPLIESLENTTEQLTTYKAERFVKYHDSDEWIPRYNLKYNAAFYGYGCHVDNCDWSGQTFTEVLNFEECLADCYQKRMSGDVYGLTYDMGSKKCYCKATRIPKIYEHTGFLQFNFPKFKYKEIIEGF